MPLYPLTIRKPKKDTDEDQEKYSSRRRFSLSTPRELGPKSLQSVPRGASFSDDIGDLELGSPKILTPTHQSNRVERLLRERQLRRSGSCFQFGESEKQQEDRSNSLRQESTSSESLHTVEQVPGSSKPQRLLVVANRLPVSAVWQPDGSWSLEISAGGLVSALLGVKQNFETCWLGWPGLYPPESKDRDKLTEALKEKGCAPVFLDTETMDQYYNGYCNNVLWPLLHYIGLPQEDRLAATRSIQSQYAAYKRANEIFADTVMKHYQEGDIVWCHDYHLMLLPEYLKKRNPRMKVGWFLHTPFPSSEIYRTLPLRGEILRAILSADLVGFHTYDYARHFVSACTRILGLEGTPEGVEDQGRLTRVAAFPIGIDPGRFISALETEVVKAYVAELRARFAGRKVMLGVDRLDMIKGIPQKLLAFEKFLEENPRWRDKVLLVQIAVPSRTHVPEYQKLTSQVHEIVGRINGKFGTLTGVPIHHLDRSLAFHQLVALYAITDVCLVTSLRDGMNLVSYEYVACQNHKKGVLILSEFAGAAQSLGAGAILVNPWNVSDMSASMEDALNMSEAERTERHRHNFMHVTTHTAQAWADTFVSELNDTIVEAELRVMHIPPQLPVKEAISAYHESSNRLLILGFNSTLTPHADAPRRGTPDQIKEMKLKLHHEIPDILDTLTSDFQTTVIILSGAERSVLDEAFSGFDVWLAAENGMFLRPPNGEWMTTLPEHLHMEWVESVQLVFDYFCERTPRSYVEARETSLVWNYKFADVEFGRVQARDMLQHLWTGPISNSAVEVVQGSKSVEVRPVGVSKGAAIERIIGEIAHQKPITAPIDFVFCCGHFLPKDEDIFRFFEPDLALDGEDSGGKASGESRRGERGQRSVERNKPKKTLGEFLQRKNSSGLSPDMISKLEVGSYGRNVSREKGYWSSERLSGDSDESGKGDFVSVLDLRGAHYFSCAVGRKRSQARYSLKTSEDVIAILKSMAFNDIHPHRATGRSRTPWG